MLHVLLPVHNRIEITRRFIRCLRAQTFREYEVVLLDDGSVDGTEAMVREELGSVTVLRGDGRWWWAGALQRGYEWLQSMQTAGADVILIANDDTEFGPDFLEKALRRLQCARNTLLLAQCYDRATGQLIDQGVTVNWRGLRFDQARTRNEINCLSTRGLFLRLEDLRDIGGFRPRLLPHYLSDYEFTIRAHRKAKELTTDPEVRLVVDAAASGQHDVSAEDLQTFFRQVFSRKYSMNPLAWSAFVLLACPWPWKGVHFSAIWIRFVVQALGFALRRNGFPRG